MPPHHADGTTLDDRGLDPIWSMAQALNVPVCIHTIGAQISPIESMLAGEVMGEAYGGIPLPAVVETIGEDRLVIGSDYCHPEGMCPFTMKAFADRDDLSLEVRRKILYDNPKRLYRL